MRREALNACLVHLHETFLQRTVAAHGRAEIKIADALRGALCDLFRINVDMNIEYFHDRPPIAPLIGSL